MKHKKEILKRYYPYSVKEELRRYFGDNPVETMRKPNNIQLGAEDRSNLTPLAWQYADEQTIHLFQDNRFLTDTVLEDDYIAYIYQTEDKKCAFLMFMLYEADVPFKIDIAYAQSVIRKWMDAGYEAKILSQCIAIETDGKPEAFRFTAHVSDDVGAHIYGLTEDSRLPLLAFESHRCWQEYYTKLVHISSQNDIREFECLFAPNVSLTIGPKNKRKKVAKGIAAVKDFIAENLPVRVCYSEYRNTGVFEKVLLAGNKDLSIRVDASNLITELHYTDVSSNSIIECNTPCLQRSLVEQVPRLLNVRILDIKQMHGYALQLTFADNSIRNYYLQMFTDLRIPSSIEIDGYIFSEEILNSAAIMDNDIHFENGYVIPCHLLYYRSYRQLQIPFSDEKSYEVSGGTLKLKYTLPLKESKSRFDARCYWGMPNECYGPADALLDKCGKRVSDISFYGYGIDKWCGSKIFRIGVEPTGQCGFICEDGTWLLPPVYTSAECLGNGCARAERKINGELKKFIITPNGDEIEFPHNIDTGYFYNGLCPFNAAEGSVSAPKPGYYWEHDYDEVTAGNWGYVNIDGQIVVEPQYVYAVGFYNGGGSRAVVARLVNGELRWGAIDGSGKEVIPCIYESLYTRWGDAFAFRRCGEELYGVMDTDGNILVDPRFEFFDAYDEKHRMITVGEHEDALGIYSIDRQEMILPAEYDNIDYGERIISCELQYSCTERYFDYSGKELDFSEYDSISEEEELIRTWKDRKFGYINFDGTEVVPPILTGGICNDCLALYRKGYVITRDNELSGLSTVAGQTILPQKYAEIITHEQFVIASERTDSNFCICDTLYRYDGTPIIKGPYRNMHFDKKNQELTVDTPWGTEYYQLIQS